MVLSAYCTSYQLCGYYHSVLLAVTDRRRHTPGTLRIWDSCTNHRERELTNITLLVPAPLAYDYTMQDHMQIGCYEDCPNTTSTSPKTVMLSYQTV